MNLNFGKQQLSIPGPSVIPDRVLQAMHRPSPNIYEGELVEMVSTLYPDLKAVARTRHHCAIYIANGHGAWEAAICNTLNRGDKVLVLVTGYFGRGWGDMAAALGIEVQFLDFGNRADADPNRVEDHLRTDTAHEIRAVVTVQTDTASSVQNNIPALRRAIDAAGHPALYWVDCIASLGCDRHKMDAWGVDLMVAGCQKGLMTPAGLSFVFFNDRADAAWATAGLNTPYWDWANRTRGEIFYQKFAGTAPTHHLYGLREALDMLVHEEGVEPCWHRHEVLSEAVWAALDAWSRAGDLSMNIKDAEKRSRAVTTIRTAPDDAGRLRQWCEHEGGLTLGIGLGLTQPDTRGRDKVFRIGHMGHLNPLMLMGCLGTIDAGLKALGIPHGTGAPEAAAQRIAAG
ncbi:MAG: aminotransferase class V-fold PLP-dependent enzyme [Rhodobacteraceae bacterium]|nr:aminotransferase class V-fold PLP-dependent enzyme [Paracoccaceae bacterium]